MMNTMSLKLSEATFTVATASAKKLGLGTDYFDLYITLFTRWTKENRKMKIK